MSMKTTAMGKNIDMSALAAKHERVRAVGNMNVNARGDTIDAYGRVVTPVTEKVSESYAKTVGNKSAQPTQRTVNQVPPRKVSDPVPAIEEEQILLNSEEQDLENNLEEDLEVERIKAQETKRN